MAEFTVLRHSAQYVYARGVPGLINFVALAVYTRLLAPEEFGRYALVLVIVGLGEVVAFHWLQLVLGRYLPAHRDDPRHFLSGILALFLFLALVVSGLGGALALLWPDPIWQRLLAMAVPVMLAQAWFQLHLAIFSAQLDPGRYGRLLVSKAILALLLGAWLAWLGLGAYAPIIGLFAGQAAAALMFGLVAWRGVRPRWSEVAALRKHLNYGLPLAVTFALGWVMSSSDRLLVNWLLGETAVGVYAVGYDMAQYSLGLLLVIVHTAAFPLAVHAMERQGPETAKNQMAGNGEIVVSVALSGAAGLIVLAPQIVVMMTGDDFRAGALMVLPWAAVGAAVYGIKAFHLDVAYHLGAKSRGLVVSGALAASANIGLNLFLIPFFGIVGAVWATMLAFILAAVSSAWMGKRIFPMPAFGPLAVRGFMVALPVAGGAWFGTQLGGNLLALFSGIMGGTISGVIAAFVINLGGIREMVANMRRRRLDADISSRR